MRQAQPSRMRLETALPGDLRPAQPRRHTVGMVEASDVRGDEGRLHGDRTRDGAVRYSDQRVPRVDDGAEDDQDEAEDDQQRRQ